MSADVIVLRPSKTWRVFAHGLEHLYDEHGKLIKNKPREMVTCWGLMEFNLSSALNLKKEYGKKMEDAFKVGLGPSALVALAARRVLTRGEFRYLNGYWNACHEDPEKDTLVLYKDVHLGISYDESIPAEIDEENGRGDGSPLRVPTLHAPSMDLVPFLSTFGDLMRRMHQDHAGGKFRLRETKISELMGHTFIFNNIGAPLIGHILGGSRLTARTSAMLNMGRIASDGMTPFQLFFDHRMFSASMVTRFLKAVRNELDINISNEVRSHFE